MLDIMDEFAKEAIAAGEMVNGPITHYERFWFAHHVAVALRLAFLPKDSVFNYRSDPAERLVHGIWFSLRGMGMKDEIIEKYLKPDVLDPVIEDILVRAGMREEPASDADA